MINNLSNFSDIFNALFDGYGPYFVIYEKAQFIFNKLDIA
jgi:hypothetical protein